MKKRMKKHFQSILAMMLCISMLVSVFNITVFATETTDQIENTETITSDDAESAQLLAVVYAASDFQPYSGEADDIDSGKTAMNAIIDAMQTAGYTQVDGALICGDYSKVYNTWKIRM